MNFFIIIMGTSSSASTLLLYCYVGKTAIEDILQLGDYLYESNWYGLPIRFQMYIKLMICNTQRPLLYHGSGIAYLNTITFSKVNS